MLHRDDRGLALAIVGFVALFVVSGLLFALLNPAVLGVESTASDQASDPLVQDQINQAMQIWGVLLFFIVFLGVGGFIVRATSESRGPR